MDAAKLSKYDSRGMHKIYDRWPQIARESFEYEHLPIDCSNVDHIIFAGSGGSGTIGDMFGSIFYKTNIHISIVKGYLLPNTIDDRSLIIITSVSGNTEEALTVLDAATKIGCKVIVLASGGKIQQRCLDLDVDFRKIIQDHSPRVSFARFVYSLLKILDNILPVTRNDVLESITELEKLQKHISSSNLSDSNYSLKIAKWLQGIPLIYYPQGLNVAAIRFKNSLQENSKTHAIIEDVIETCHNGVVAWEKESIVQPILLQGTDDYIKTKERWGIIKNYFDGRNIKYYQVTSINGNILSKLINLIYLLDYATIYYAVLSETDPSTVDSINFIKKRL